MKYNEGKIPDDEVTFTAKQNDCNKIFLCEDIFSLNDSILLFKIVVYNCYRFC